MKRTFLALAIAISLSACSSLPEHLQGFEAEYSQMLKDYQFWATKHANDFGKICPPYGQWRNGSKGPLNLSFKTGSANNVIICDPACGLGVKNYQSSSTIEPYISPETDLNKCQKYLDDIRYYLQHREVKAVVEKRETEKREFEENEKAKLAKYELEKKRAIAKAKKCYDQKTESCKQILVDASNYGDGEAQYRLALLSIAEGSVRGYEYYLAKASTNKHSTAQLLLAGICQERQMYDIRYLAPRLAFLYLSGKNGNSQAKKGYKAQLDAVDAMFMTASYTEGKILGKILRAHSHLIKFFEQNSDYWTRDVWLNVYYDS